MENLKLCEKCKGACCKRLAGACAPSDVPDWEERIKPDGDLEIVWDLIGHPKQFEKCVSKQANEVYNQAVEIIPELAEMVKDHITLLWCVRPKSKHGKKDYSVKFIYTEVERPCIHLTDAGCALKHDDRPYECRNLVPNKVGRKYKCGGSATDFKDKFLLFKEWMPYQEKLVDIALDRIVKDAHDTRNVEIDKYIGFTERDVLQQITARINKSICGTEEERANIDLYMLLRHLTFNSLYNFDGRLSEEKNRRKALQANYQING